MSLILTREALSNQIADDLATRNANAGVIEGAVDAKAESADVYTKTENDSLLGSKESIANVNTLKGTGWTTETVKGNADDIATLNGDDSTDGSVAKSIKDNAENATFTPAVGSGITSVVLKDAVNEVGARKVKLTKMPDGATAVYSQDAWTTANGWDTTYMTFSSPSAGIARFTQAGANFINRNVAGITGKIGIARIRNDGLKSTQIACDSGLNTILKIIAPSTEWQVVLFQIPASLSAGSYGFTIPSGVAGNYFEIDWIWIGDYSYLENSLATEASRIANQLGDTAGVGTKASGTITSNGTNVSDGDTVTIAGKVYTFRTTLTPADGEVLISSTTPSLTMLRLGYAINRYNPSGLDNNTYKISAPHPLVYAVNNDLTVILYSGTSSGTGTQQTYTSKTGILGNSITLAKSATTLTLSGSTLTGGTDDVGQKVYTQVKDIIAGGIRPAQADISDTSTLIGYENSVDVASGGTTTLPAGGTFRWSVYGYGATIGSAKKGTSAGGTVLTVAGANATVWYRRIA